MEFSGRVYFDVASADCWRFYQLIARAFEERVQVRLEWRSWVAGGLGDRPLVGQERAQAAYEWVREAAPTKQGPFLQALFVAVHQEAAPPEDLATIALAARLAGLDPDLVGDLEIDGQGRRLLEISTREGDDLGVAAVPSVYRLGPVLQVRTTGAVTRGRAADRLETINRMLGDDGLWELRKP
jgi:predicted DsbA family dithiol-disulfide isomerase